MAASAIVVGIACALVFGLRVGQSLHGAGTLVSVIFEPDKSPPPPPQPKPEPKPAVKSAAKGDPSPRNLRNKAAQVVAPPPRIVIAVPPPVPVATQQPGLGSAASNGASDRPGPGQGAGGFGNGFGGGGDGGDGDGTGRPATGPRQIRGKLSFSDLPDDLLEEGDEASVGVRYTVEPDGRVSHCIADEPSGLSGLDSLTCRLIEQRFRFRPARNRAGLPVRSTIAERHSWFRQPDDS